nr:hypothetical protein CFP56_44660 [Quercus suber]
MENQPRVDAAHIVNILADALVSEYANTIFDLIALPVHLSLGLGLGAWDGKLGRRRDRGKDVRSMVLSGVGDVGIVKREGQ